MNFKKFFIGLLTLLVLFTVNSFAQEKEEMTEEEWQNEINRLTDRKFELETELNTLRADIDRLNATKMNMQAYEDCMSELYSLVGATTADVNNYRDQVNALERKIDNQEEAKADRQAELDALKTSKISALPEFYDKVHNQLQRKLDAWVVVPTSIQYTVVRGDCLWNIAKKSAHYDNAFAWPMIYNANRDKIKDPDLIYPKQEFEIPNLTDEEKAKYDKIRRNYKPAPTSQTGM